MTDHLPAIISPGALTTPTDTYIVPALIADLGDQAGWRYVKFFTANINNDHNAASLCACLQPVFRLVRKPRALADEHSAVRRRGAGKGTAGEARGAGGQAAACGRAHASQTRRMASSAPSTAAR
jgi:hypothetical protein